MVHQAFQETGLDAGPVGRHATDKRSLIEVDESDVRIGSRQWGDIFDVFGNVGVVFRGITARARLVVGVVLVVLVLRGGRGAGPPILLNPLKGLVQRAREGCLALAPFDPLDPLQQTSVVDGQQMRDVLRRRPVPERRQELVEQVVGRPPPPRRRTVEVQPHAQAVVRLPLQYPL